VSGDSVTIKVNDDIGRYFHTKKCLILGHLLSPMLFYIVADMLAIMIERAKADGQIEGVLPHVIDGVCLSFSMSMTQYFLWNMISKRLETYNLF
jgi:hypothetical protein